MPTVSPAAKPTQKPDLEMSKAPDGKSNACEAWKSVNAAMMTVTTVAIIRTHSTCASRPIESMRRHSSATISTTIASPTT